MVWPGPGDAAAERYERLRAYVLVPAAGRRRASPAQFDLHRFQRRGLLGLVDPASWSGTGSGGRFDVRVLAIETADARERWDRLCDLVVGLVKGGGDATSGTVCASLDGVAGEGADDPQPVGRHHALR